MKKNDVSGNKYGKLYVTSMASDYISPKGIRLSRCNCVCECGREIVVNLSDLKAGKTQSCGCLKNTAGLLMKNADLMEKYDFDKNKNIKLETLTARSSRKIWWKCKECNNSWLATIASQNDRIRHGCPYCSGRLVIKGKTDLSSQYPDIVNTWWDYEKNSISPDEISPFSVKKVWWICEEGHCWRATVANKVKGSGCPKCNKEKVSSFVEQAVYYYIKRVFPDAINGDMHLGIELDIYIPSIQTAIEYDGNVWHKSSKKRQADCNKNQLCKNNNIKMIRIREPELDPIEDCTVVERGDSTTSASLNSAIFSVISLVSDLQIDVDVDRDTTEILKQYVVSKEKRSLLYSFPEIAAEWHTKKNGGLTPDKVYKASRRIVWWQGKCGHEWQMRISERTRVKPQGCPYCNGSRVLKGENDLGAVRPDIALKWHPIKNGNLRPEEIRTGSDKMIWWLGECGHEWKQTPYKQCLNDKCPICEEKSHKVICIELDKEFKNAVAAAVFIGLKEPTSIYRCLSKSQKTAGGFHWKYAYEK